MLFVLFSMVTFSGCTRTVIKYVDKPYPVEVPVKCVVPDVNCSFDRGTKTEVISSMLECIIDLKKAGKVCK